MHLAESCVHPTYISHSHLTSPTHTLRTPHAHLTHALCTAVERFKNLTYAGIPIDNFLSDEYDRDRYFVARPKVHWSGYMGGGCNDCMHACHTDFH